MNTKKAIDKFAVKTIFFLAFFVVLVALSFFSQESSRPVKAASDNEKLEKKEGELESLEQKARNYQRMINLKHQQQMTLQNQLKMMDIQIDNFENEILITQKDLNRNKSELDQIQRQIDQTNDELNMVKDNLGEMIRIYHQIDQEFAIEFLGSDKSGISSVLNQSEYIDQTSQKVEEILQDVKKKKTELEIKQSEYKEKTEQLKAKETDIKEKVFYLGNEKVSKKILLNKTHGEESKYQVLLKRVEEQKKELIGDIESLSDEKREELDDILKKAKKPTSGTASTKWYYAQNDTKWGYKRIGLSSSLMKDYGCAVTALSMVFTYYDEDITPGKLSSQPIFYRDLIVWPENWKGLELTSSKSHGNVDWNRVKKELKKDRPVIVFVRARTGAGHYVVIHGRDKNGKYIVHDPLFGPNLYLDTTKDLVGAIYDSSTTIDQMLIYKD
ncbi:MAG: C39 family peptidase [Patescibacteria group bacterium]|nr:C39 family peptidase [Patescibacteria group bacterium]